MGRILALTGGVGGAKLALGLSQILAPDELLFAVNTGDDFEHLGLHIISSARRQFWCKLSPHPKVVPLYQHCNLAPWRAETSMKAFDSTIFRLPLPDKHRFPMAKYSRLAARIREELPEIELLEAPRATPRFCAVSRIFKALFF